MKRKKARCLNKDISDKKTNRQANKQTKKMKKKKARSLNKDISDKKTNTSREAKKKKKVRYLTNTLATRKQTDKQASGQRK